MTVDEASEVLRKDGIPYSCARAGMVLMAEIERLKAENTGLVIERDLRIDINEMNVIDLIRVRGALLKYADPENWRQSEWDPEDERNCGPFDQWDPCEHLGDNGYDLAQKCIGVQQ